MKIFDLIKFEQNMGHNFHEQQWQQEQLLCVIFHLGLKCDCVSRKQWNKDKAEIAREIKVNIVVISNFLSHYVAGTNSAPGADYVRDGPFPFPTNSTEYLTD
jgi:hydroxylamine reductase (hybrid-cluster protein)